MKLIVKIAAAILLALLIAYTAYLIYWKIQLDELNQALEDAAPPQATVQQHAEQEDQKK